MLVSGVSLSPATPWASSSSIIETRGGQLTFGSEIRAVLAADKQRPEVDPVALEQFLQFRYTPSPLTIFSGIRKLAPGTMLIVENGTLPGGAVVQLHACSLSE